MFNKLNPPLDPRPDRARPAMVSRRPDDAIVCAMANPIPEIMPELIPALPT